ncbi:HK97 family phage prohead protease [Micromonospora sp. NBC_01655]|uniref:HK97 family phage prohead protease n=1 Tax=Micromonospora sp. NBC_01655 TaxID=2975983 RepID=UPI0022504DE1|nr:HK97 family phage prohead protease [Micromonospora sp. NBC_01655]MCX4468960.1 HK97 family phage prohead protease [Micromonospora sp. NBC_01655]
MTTYLRTWALDDISRSRTGDGRTVTAYAAVFDTPTEVRDQHGHYHEEIHRAAFNRTAKAGRAVCLYNHGMTLDGKPNGTLQVPLGTPLEIRPDGRGLLTVTRYNRSDTADAVLAAIDAGDIKAQSFRGRVIRSNPMGRIPRARPGQPLPKVTRLELGLSDYGPTPIPYYEGAAIVAVRSAVQLVDQLDDDQRAELLAALTATPANAGPGAEDPHQPVHSGRLAIRRARIRADMIRLGIRK